MAGHRRFPVPALLLGLLVMVSTAAWAGPEGGPEGKWPLGDPIAPPGSGLDLRLSDENISEDGGEAEWRGLGPAPSSEYLSPSAIWSRHLRESFEINQILRLRRFGQPAYPE